MNDLAGFHVLVTRPARQSRKLCELIRTAGGEAIPWPVIEILPAPDLAPIRAKVGPIAAYDLVIFVSANAVGYGAALLGSAAVTVAAIGPATAASLIDRGYRVGIVPRSGYTSEALLAEPALAAGRLRRALIVRGEGGREALARELERRGTEVRYAEVYRRAAPIHDPAQLAALEKRWARGEIHAATATSVEILSNLHAMLGGAGRAALARTPLVTASARVVKQAASLGLTGPVTLADAPSDEALLRALLETRRGIDEPA